MTGILNALLGSAGVSKNTFNITAGVVGAGAGYDDGTGGTSTGTAGGSITGGTLTGGKIICEVSSFGGLAQDRFRVRGFTTDPGQNWLISLTVNGVTKPFTNMTYSYDATHGTANWIWATGHGFDWTLVNGTTYNGNTVTHS